MALFLEYVLGWNLAATICLIVGIVLMVVEMFTPGFGLAGGLGIVALLAAVVLRADNFVTGMITLALILLILLLFGVFFFRSFSKGKLSRSSIVLQDAIQGESTSCLLYTSQLLLLFKNKMEGILFPPRYICIINDNTDTGSRQGLPIVHGQKLGQTGIIKKAPAKRGVL